MNDIDRRNFLVMSSAGAAALGLGNTAAGAADVEEGDSPAVRFHGDGLGLTPGEYATCLSQLAAEETIEPDYYSRGGSVEKLERRMAELLGKERAVFFPTGTLANQLAVRVLAGEEGRVLLQEESHLYNDSGDCCQRLSNLPVIGLAPGEATFSLEQVQAEVARAASGRVSTPIRVIGIESPVRRLWQQVFDFDEMQRISAFAREEGIGMHLDGARLFLAPAYTGISVKEYASLFDTVYISLWKYFNAGSGAILAGPDALLKEMFHTRRMYGGSLPYGWAFAAVALHYMEGFSDRFQEAVGVSEEVFKRLEQRSDFEIERVAGGTNTSRLKVAGTDAQEFRRRLSKLDIDLPEPLADGTGFKIQVNETWRFMAPAQIAEALIEARTG
jgi:threonine aldolase